MDRTSVRAIIPKDNGIILIHRIKQDAEYFVFPGGGIEDGETAHGCVTREAEEELGIKVKPIKELYRIVNNNKLEIFFLCEYISGEIGSGTGPEYTSADYSTRGQYLPKVIDIDRLAEINVLPNTIIDDVVRDVADYLLKKLI